jgi:hypothetical protein
MNGSDGFGGMVSIPISLVLPVLLLVVVGGWKLVKLLILALKG